MNGQTWLIKINKYLYSRTEGVGRQLDATKSLRPTLGGGPAMCGRSNVWTSQRPPADELNG